jgi:Tol biopolymer transport system component
MHRRGTWLLVLASAVAFVGCSTGSMRPLLFQAQLPGDSEDLYRFNLESDRVTRLTTGDAAYANSFPTWSPVDDRIAFVRQRSGADSLFLLIPDAASPRPVATPSLPVLGPPAWSPDGRSILISAGPDVPRRRLYIANVDDRTFRELPLPEGMFDCGTYSPEGDRVVASRSVGDSSEIVIIDPAVGITDVLVTSDSLSFHCPEWSPKGDVIGVAVYSRDYSRAGLRLISPGSGEIVDVALGPGHHNAPKWSPDGETIAYQCTPRTPQDPDFFQRMEICLVGRDGGDVRQLTSNDYFDAHPSW